LICIGTRIAIHRRERKQKSRKEMIMRDINKVMLMGRLGADPVLRTTQNGVPVANFSLATDHFYKERQESETTWHRIVAWGKTAEICQQYLQKGMPLLVEGRIRTHKYEGEDGKAKYSTEVHADQIYFLGSKTKSQNDSDSKDANSVELNALEAVQ
jgi:single-strand DNA-binding protein